MLILPQLKLTFEVRKINKRLYVWCVETEKPFYTPPDFLYAKLKSREPLTKLAQNMSNSYYDEYFEHIFNFETRYYER